MSTAALPLLSLQRCKIPYIYLAKSTNSKEINEKKDSYI